MVAVILQLACAAGAVVRRIADLIVLLIYLHNLGLLLLDGGVGGGVEALLHASAEVRGVV